MQRFALMLTILALVGIAAAVGTTRADAEEVTTTSTTPTTTTGCDVGEELYKGVCGVPDMGFNRFHTWRTFHRYWAHEAAQRKCQPHSKYHFKVSSANIKPWRRSENLTTWKNKHNRVKEKASVCFKDTLMDWYYSSGAKCVHEGEGAWNDPDSPYYGGFQADISFQRSYNPGAYATYGTADHWPIIEQIEMAYNGWKARGWYPWPVTARNCGLI